MIYIGYLGSSLTLDATGSDALRYVSVYLGCFLSTPYFVAIVTRGCEQVFRDGHNSPVRIVFQKSSWLVAHLSHSKH